MSFLLLQALTGLAAASSLFLVSAGLTVIFGVTRIVNFAHGSLTMLGAYVGWSVLGRLPGDPASFVAGVLATGAAIGLLGIGLETALLRRLYRAPELLQLLATFGVVLMVEDAALAIWGAQELTLPRPPWMRAAMHLLGTRFPQFDLVLIAVGPAVLALLWLLFTRTRWGTLVRAATQDRDMLAALGVNQRWLFTSVVALGAGLAGIGGALGLPEGSANPALDLETVTDAFVVVVVGGLGSLPGAFLASVLVGELRAFATVLVPQAASVVVFGAMALVLVARPRGLLGRSVAPGRAEAAPALVRATPRAAVWLGAAVLLGAAVAPAFAGPFALAVLTEMAVAVLFAASLHFMMGPGGMPSFGHAAWFGIGAYATALATTGTQWPMPLAIMAAPVAAGLVAALVGAAVVRLDGVYMAMLTLAFAQVVWAVAFQWTGLLGGDNGLLGVWPAAWAATPARFAWLAVAVCASATWMLRRVLAAPFGYALRATRDSPRRAAASGIAAPAVRLAAFAVASAAAGLAGGVAALSKGSVFPSFVAVGRSVDALLMVLLGGVDTLSGPIVGAIAYTGLADTLLLVTDSWRFVLGALIVALVLAFPQGIAGAVRARWRAA